MLMEAVLPGLQSKVLDLNDCSPEFVQLVHCVHVSLSQH